MNEEKSRIMNLGKGTETGDKWYRNKQEDTPGSVVTSEAGKGR